MLGNFDQGPYLSAAVICEKVLDERDGVKSAIRMVDRITRTYFGPNPPAEMEPFDYDMTLLIRFKSGRARGLHTVSIEIEKPSGEKSPQIQNSVVFEGEDDRGIDIVAHVRIRFALGGLYWIYVSLNNVRLTKIPFRVTYIPQSTQATGSSGQLPPPNPPFQP